MLKNINLCSSENENKTDSENNTTTQSDDNKNEVPSEFFEDYSVQIPYDEDDVKKLHRILHEYSVYNVINQNNDDLKKASREYIDEENIWFLGPLVSLIVKNKLLKLIFIFSASKNKNNSDAFNWNFSDQLIIAYYLLQFSIFHIFFFFFLVHEFFFFLVNVLKIRYIILIHG